MVGKLPATVGKFPLQSSCKSRASNSNDSKGRQSTIINLALTDSSFLNYSITYFLPSTQPQVTKPVQSFMTG